MIEKEKDKMTANWNAERYELTEKIKVWELKYSNVQGFEQERVIIDHILLNIRV